MASLLSYALTDLASVKESLGISVSTYDNLIIRKINQATRAIENYCGRRFASTTYTQVEYGSSQTDEIVLNQRPVIALTALEIRDSGLNENNWETIDTQLYFVDYSAGIVKLDFNARGGWGHYRISYQAGYASIPGDLSEACATLAAYYVTNASGARVGSQSVKEGQREQKFSSNNHLLTFNNILAQLGLDSIINYYANYPVATDM